MKWIGGCFHETVRAMQETREQLKFQMEMHKTLYDLKANRLALERQRKSQSFFWLLIRGAACPIALSYNKIACSTSSLNATPDILYTLPCLGLYGPATLKAR
jgi:hypothetical protein